MAGTGVGIRDFFKTTRSVQFDSQGSIRLTSVEQAAYRSSLTIEILAFRGQRYISYKQLPDETHWGYATFFDGSAVREKVAVKFAKQRLFEVVNDSLWHHYQATESTRLIGRTLEAVGDKIVSSGGSEGGLLGLGRIVWDFVVEVGELAGKLLTWLVSLDDSDGENALGVNAYNAYPVVPKMPSLVKFLSDLPCDFTLTLESWYLTNPAVLITGSPVDTGDETDGENEYPDPEKDTDKSGESSPDPDSDSRDFVPLGDENSPGASQIRVTVPAYGNPELIGGDPTTYVSVIIVGGDARGKVSVEFTGQVGNTSALGTYQIGWRLKAFGQVVYTEIVSLQSLPVPAVLYFKNGIPS